MTARLTVLNGPNRDQEYLLGADIISVGRGNECQIRLDDRSVSRNHATLKSSPEGEVTLICSGERPVKVEGRKVPQAVLLDGQKVQIGSTVFRFSQVDPPTLSSASPPQVKESPLPQNNEQRPLAENQEERAVELETRGEEKELEIEAPQNATSSKTLKAIFFVLLLALGIWTLTNIEPTPPPVAHLPYRIGVEKLVDVSGYLTYHGVKGRPRELEVDRPRSLSASLLPPPYSILKFKTLAKGDAKLTLLSSQGDPLLIFHFHILPDLHEDVQRYEIERISPEERIAMAQRSVNHGDLISRDQPAASHRHYREALELLETVSTTHSLYFEASKKFDIHHRHLTQRLKELWAEESRNRSNKLYERALQNLNEIIDLIGDPDDLDVQKAQIHKKHCLRKIET